MNAKKTKLLACVLLLACGLSGCQDTSPKNDSAGEPGDAKATPLGKDGSTLTIGVTDNYYSPMSYTKNLPVWQEVEKQTGVSIEWNVNPTEQYNDVMRVRLAAASGLPDILQLPDSPVSYGKDGLILPLNDLIDQHAPHIKQFLDDNPYIRRLLQAPDGNIYALSSVVSGTDYTDPSGVLIRKDWLDKLGLQEPTTLDEWYTVLKAFKEKDPNGNGKADEIPFSPRYSWGGAAEIFGHALGLHVAGYCRGFDVDENGRLQYGWMDPKAEKLVGWLRKLFEEGLLDPEFMSKKADKILSDIALERVGSTNHFLNATAKFNAAVGTGKANWMLALPPADPGVERFYEKSGPIASYYGISKDAEDPALAIRWLDYIYASEEGARLLAFGVEGLSYTMVDGKPQFTDFIAHNPDGLDPANALRSIGAFPTLPWIRSQYGPFSLQPKALLSLDPAMMAQADRVRPYLVDTPPIRFMLATNEEIEKEKKLSVNIETYVEESVLQFIYGRKTIDWEAFRSTLIKLGINDWLAIKQQQYDRIQS
ncbi:extracellular solute-binding protein [Paenibacillus oryzisoli]|uniref:extracellular solute-binding protein n=1 Tax=Paenibacillus oryzisoli TaxID=1850517 RepID=UPI003D29A039